MPALKSCAWGWSNQSHSNMRFWFTQPSTTNGYKVTIGVLRIREQDRQRHGVSGAAYSAWVFLSAISLQTGERLGEQKKTDLEPLTVSPCPWPKEVWKGRMVLEMVEGHQRRGRPEMAGTGKWAILELKPYWCMLCFSIKPSPKNRG